MRKILLVTAALFSLSACSFFQNIVTPNPNIVAGLESGLAAADDAAIVYLSLDSCKVSSAPCRDAGITLQIDASRTAAFNAITAAEANETADLVTSAQNALTIYENLVNALQTKTQLKNKKGAKH